MRRASFAVTRAQMLARTKRVTRRLSWLWAESGMRLRAMTKTRGVRSGDEDDLGIIEITEVRREPLEAITDADVTAEGLDHLNTTTPGEGAAAFVAMFCEVNRGCTPRTEVTVVTFVWADEIEQRPAEVHRRD